MVRPATFWKTPPMAKPRVDLDVVKTTDGWAVRFRRVGQTAEWMKGDTLHPDRFADHRDAEKLRERLLGGR